MSRLQIGGYFRQNGGQPGPPVSNESDAIGKIPRGLWEPSRECETTTCRVGTGNHKSHKLLSVVDETSALLPHLCEQDGELSTADHRRGTLGSSALHLVTTVMGTGILALPKTMADMGWVPGCIFLVIFGFVSDYSAQILFRLAARTGLVELEDMARYYLGRKGQIVTQASLLLLLLGVVLMITTLIGDLVCPLWRWALALDQFDTFFGSRWFVTLLVLIAVFPFTIVEEISALKHTSSAAMVSSVLVILAVIYKLVFEKQQIDPSVRAFAFGAPSSSPSASSDMTYSSTAFLVGIPIQLMSYVMQFQVTPLYHEMRPADRPRFSLSIHWAMAAVTLSYVIFALAGYFYFGQGVKGDVLKGFDAEESKDMKLGNAISGAPGGRTHPSLLVGVCRFCVAIVNIFKLPLICLPLRRGLARLRYPTPPTPLPSPDQPEPTTMSYRETLVTMGLVFLVCYVVGNVMRDLSASVELVGATVGIAVALLLPILLLYKAVGKGEMRYSLGSIFMSAATLLLAVASSCMFIASKFLG